MPVGSRRTATSVTTQGNRLSIAPRVNHDRTSDRPITGQVKPRHPTASARKRPQADGQPQRGKPRIRVYAPTPKTASRAVLTEKRPAGLPSPGRTSGGSTLRSIPRMGK